jgi:hypothetical protein
VLGGRDGKTFTTGRREHREKQNRKAGYKQ